jgi:hypothetical protein
MTVTGTEQRVYGTFLPSCAGYAYHINDIFSSIYIGNDRYAYYTHDKTFSVSLHDKYRIKTIILGEAIYDSDGSIITKTYKQYTDTICVPMNGIITPIGIDDALWIQNINTGMGMQFHQGSILSHPTCTHAEYGLTYLGCCDITDLVNIEENPFNFFIDITSFYIYYLGGSIPYIIFLFDTLPDIITWPSTIATTKYNVSMVKYTKKACDNKVKGWTGTPYIQS